MRIINIPVANCITRQNSAVAARHGLAALGNTHQLLRATYSDTKQGPARITASRGARKLLQVLDRELPTWGTNSVHVGTGKLDMVRRDNSGTHRREEYRNEGLTS